MRAALVAGLLAASAAAHPATKAKRFSIKSEDDSTVASSAVNILTYALMLEHLEDTFYRGGLANFTQAQFASAGFDAVVYANLQAVARDEKAHVAFLTTALTGLGAAVPAECVYNFPYTDPKSFITLATILEGVGVSAYLGAAADIGDPDYLTAAGSILTIEARHASYLRAQISDAPFPAAYDTPLDFDQVYSLAWPFFVSCPPGNPKLGVVAFPRLALNTTGTISAGTNINLSTSGYVLANADKNGPAPLYGAFMSPTGPIFQPATAVPGGYSVEVPQGVAGQVYVIITACADKVTDDTTLAGPAIVEVAPSMT